MSDGVTETALHAGGDEAPAVPLAVGYVIGTYPIVTTTFIEREIAALRRMGWRIEVVSLRRPTPRERPLGAPVDEGVVALLPARHAAIARAILSTALRQPLASLRLGLHLVTRPHPGLRARWRTALHVAEGLYATAVLRPRHVDHLHAHFADRAATVALVAARLLHVGYSVTAHANDIYRDPVMLREKLGAADVAITVSAFNRSHLVATHGLDPSRIAVIHGWVETRRWRSEDSARPAEATLFPLLVLSVGRLVEKKGHRELIDACRLLVDRGVDVECEIVGDGPLRSELESRVVRLGLGDRVRLPGPDSEDGVRQRLARADVFALPCVVAADGDRDGIPVALAEAMAMSVPVVSTTLVGIRELVTEGTGLLVEPNDPAALADALATVAAMTAEQRQALGRRARRRVEEAFEVDSEARRLAGLFAASVAARRQGRAARARGSGRSSVPIASSGRER